MGKGPRSRRVCAPLDARRGSQLKANIESTGRGRSCTHASVHAAAPLHMGGKIGSSADAYSELSGCSARYGRGRA
eukprot:2952896-Prymnesium_polylepis.1